MPGVAGKEAIFFTRSGKIISQNQGWGTQGPCCRCGGGSKYFNCTAYHQFITCGCGGLNGGNTRAGGVKCISGSDSLGFGKLNRYG